MTLVWPDILKARSRSVNPRNLFRTGGRSINGNEQRVFNDAGRLEVTYSSIVIRNRDQARVYRAMLARLRAGEDILLKLFDLYLPVGARGANVAVSVSAHATLRATQLGLNAVGLDIEDGHWLSIGDRLHLVTGILAGPAAPPFLNQVATDVAWSDEVPWSDAVAGSANYTITILPPLRAPAPAGAVVRFRDLTLRAVLKEADDGDLELDLGRFATPSITFVEDF